MKKSLGLVGVLVMFCVTFGWSQSVSVKKEIAVFNLCYYDFTIPSGALGMIDSQIKNVFTNLGRFSVIGMEHSLTENDVSSFIDKIKAFKERNLEIPEGVSLGREIFTEADFNRLTGSFVVVIPSVSFYNLELLDNAQYQVTLRTTVTFVDVSAGTTIASRSIETFGTDENPNEALKFAADQLPSRLEYEIRKIDTFTLKSGIIDVDRGTVMIEFGNNMGVKVGDEYVIVTPRMLSTGHETTEETGLLLVREVQQDVSFARVIYADSKPVVGDQVKEIPRMGVDLSLYAELVSGGFDSDSDLVLGLRGVTSRGFYSFRPAFGLEIPLARTFAYGRMPIIMYFGAELANLYLGRLQVTPFAAAGFGGTVPLGEYADEEFYLSHAGIKGQLSVSYLLGRDTRVFATAGYAKWFGLAYESDGFGGLYLGGGITFKN